MKRIIKILIVLLSVFSYNLSVFSQTTNNQITPDEKKNILRETTRLIAESYINEEVGLKTVQYLNENLNTGKYDTLNNVNEFANRISADLVTISKDKHFRLLFDPNWVADYKKAVTKNEKDDLLNRDIALWRKDNFGFKELKILDGNIGYLNLTSFKNPKYAGKTAEAALAFLSNANAIIIDFRENGGGISTMVQLLASYFFDSEPIQMGDSYSRQTGKHTQDWTLPYVNGQRLPEVPLYILTSKESYSAAEGFTYFMKNRKRATVIGETTGGAAQPIERVAVSDRFYMWLPTQRPVDPITNANWEGTGIDPDIKCPVKAALHFAHLTALENLNKKKIIDNNTYDWITTYLNTKQNPAIVNPIKLKNYAGNFDSRKLLFEGGDLYYQRNGDEKYKLIPMTDSLFVLNEINYLRIKIDFKNDKVIGMTRLYIDGTSRTDIKIK